MTTAYHDPIIWEASAAPATINGPLGQLDAAIALAITSGSGWSTTLDGTAASGQKVVPVAETTGAVAGQVVWFRSAGGTSEPAARTIASVSAGVSITLNENLTNTYTAGALVSASPAEIVDARGWASSLGGRIGLIEARVLDVKRYGATGDGTTDDLAAFNATVTDLPTCTVYGVTGQMGTIYVPSGTYRLSNDWAIDAEAVHVELAPGAVIFTDGATTNGVTIGFIGNGYGLGTAVTPQRMWASIHGGTVYNLNNGTADNAIGFVRFQNARCEGVRVPICGRKAISAQYGVSNVHFARNIISTTGHDAITVETTCVNVHIENNEIASAGGKGINVTTAINDAHVISNIIYDSVGDSVVMSGVGRGWVTDNTLVSAGGSGVSGLNCADLVVARNIIVLPQTHGITLTSGTGRIEVASNFLDRVGQAAANTCDAIVFTSCASRPIITGNRIAGTNHRYAENAITMSGGAAVSIGNILITGGSGAYGGYVPATLNDLVDGFAMVAAHSVEATTTIPLHVVQGSVAPIAGTWLRGDQCWNTSPSAAGVPGWVCTTAGTPGTWRAMAALAA